MSLFRRVWLVVLSGLVLSGCAVFGTGRFGDRWSKERNAFMQKELAWTVRPEGTVGGELRSSDAMSGDGVLATSRSVGAEAQFFAPKNLTATDLADFYVDLFAKQGHRNIYVTCGDDQPEGIAVYSAAWLNHYGYVISAVFSRQNPKILGAGIVPDATPTDPFLVQVSVAGNRKMFKGNDEDPVKICLGYPLERMKKVLAPYGLTPYEPKPHTWFPFHRELGERDSYRKAPPHVTLRFAPLPTTLPK